MSVLLVWQALGDSCSFYAISDPSSSDIKSLHAANGQYVGLEGDTSGADKLSDMLSEMDDWCVESGAEHNCVWKDCKIEEEQLPGAGPFDRVYTSGFCA